MVNYLGAQHPKRVDMTTEKIYSLSDESVKVADQAKQDVHILAFYPGGEYQPPKELLELFKNRNFHGAVVKLDHGIRLLEAFPESCHGVDVGRLRRDATRARAALLELGPERLDQFPTGLTLRVHFVDEKR